MISFLCWFIERERERVFYLFSCNFDLDLRLYSMFVVFEKWDGGDLMKGRIGGDLGQAGLVVTVALRS